MATHFSVLVYRTPGKVYKDKKNMTPEDKSSRPENVQYATVEEIALERMKWLFQSRNNAQLYMFLVVLFLVENKV